MLSVIEVYLSVNNFIKTNIRKIVLIFFNLKESFGPSIDVFFNLWDLVDVINQILQMRRTGNDTVAVAFHHRSEERIVSQVSPGQLSRNHQLVSLKQAVRNQTLTDLPTKKPVPLFFKCCSTTSKCGTTVS